MTATTLRGDLPLRVIRTATTAAALDLRCLCGHTRTTEKDTSLVQAAAHCMTCRPGADLAARHPGRLAGEQPVRLIRGPRTLAMVCVCGCEATSWRYGSTSEIVRLKAHLRQPAAGPDLTIEGLGVLLRHTGCCPAAARWGATQVSVGWGR